MSDLTHELKQDYLDIHIHHRDTYTILFKFKDTDDVDCNPIVCFCLRIFKKLCLHYIRSLQNISPNLHVSDSSRCVTLLHSKMVIVQPRA